MSVAAAPWRTTLLAALALPAAMAAGEEAEGVRMPDLEGALLEDATTDLASLGVEVIVQRLQGPARIGAILLQIPEPGEALGRRLRVFLQVSDGVVMPDLVDRTETEARNLLRDLGVTMLASAPQPATAGEPVVVTQFPPAGERIDASAEAATAVLSPLIAVPSFAGQRVERAQEVLGGLGLVVERNAIEKVPISAGRCEGYVPTVVDSDPKAGTLIRPGGRVVLHFGFTPQTNQLCLEAPRDGGRIK